MIFIIQSCNLPTLCAKSAFNMHANFNRPLSELLIIIIINKFFIPLRQIITSKKWLHQSGSGIISVNKINTSSGLADTNKDKKHAKHQNSKCTNI